MTLFWTHLEVHLGVRFGGLGSWDLGLHHSGSGPPRWTPFWAIWGSPDAPVWGLKPLVSVYWPLEAIPYHARARRYIGNPRSLGSIYGSGIPGIRVRDPKSPSSQPGSWRPGSQMGPFGPPIRGESLSNCPSEGPKGPRSVASLYQTAHLRTPNRPFGTPDLRYPA